MLVPCLAFSSTLKMEDPMGKENNSPSNDFTTSKYSDVLIIYVLALFL
jgi:hypothetical protein